MLKCVVIYNPNSGKLTNRNEIKRLYKLLENYGYDTQIIYTEYKGHAKEIVKKMDDVDLLLCAGGDGTLNEVIWQNNLNFFLSLMNYAKDGYNNADWEYYVNKANDNIDSDYDYSELYLKDALELADLIFKTNQDKIDFLKQYVKSINDTNYSYDRVIGLTK